MTTSRSRYWWAGFSGILLALNAAIVWRLFHTEYLSQTGSIEAIYIAYARYARDHWPDLGWCNLWFGGMPFQNAYVPALHLTVASASWLAHVSAASAFHFVIATMYCLGPVTLFWMAHRLTGAMGWSFVAGLMYSLVSPSAFLVGDIRHDLGGVFRAQRLHSMVFYGDSPHVVSLTLIPLAILAIDLALKKNRPIYHAAAVLALAAVPLTNWPGAIVLAFAVLAYGLAQDAREWRRTWGGILGFSALGYAIDVPWMPPSTLATIARDTQSFEPVDRFTPHHLIYVGAFAAGTALVLWVCWRWRVARYLRFFLLFTLYMGGITLSSYWGNVTMLAQPRRFHLAMEMGIVLALVFAVKPLFDGRVWAMRVAAVALAGLCIVQFVQYRHYAHDLIRGVDMTQTSEYKTSRWLDEHLPGERVMVPGSTSFWLDVFSDMPELTGCCDESVVNQMIRIANYGLVSDLTVENRASEVSELWFRALGVAAVAVSGPHSTEVYKPFYHPKKFEGHLPVLWREGDDVIYGVPYRAYSLAHAVDAADMVARTPIHGVDTDPLIRYDAAIDRPESRMAVKWLNNETAVMSGTVQAGQLVSVMVPWHFGWHATAGGAARRVFEDKLGFIAIEPGCGGECTVRLYYDGGTEMTVARWVSWSGMGLIVLWVGMGLLRRGRGVAAVDEVVAA